MSSQRTVELTLYGVDFRLKGEFVPRRPPKITADPYYSHPGEGGEFLIDELTVAGFEMLDLLDDSIVEEIAEAAYERCEDEE